jgi:hypothetical protein
VNYTSEQLAACFELWQEFIDPMASIEFEEFIALSKEQRLALIIQTFPLNNEQTTCH